MLPFSFDYFFVVHLKILLNFFLPLQINKIIIFIYDF